MLEAQRRARMRLPLPGTAGEDRAPKATPLQKLAFACGDWRELCIGVDRWITALAPGGQATLKRADALDALLPEEQRHTGAGGFVGSSTVEDDLAIAW